MYELSWIQRITLDCKEFVTGTLSLLKLILIFDKKWMSGF